MAKLPWKLASTLILASRNGTGKSTTGFDYKFLLLKRSAKSGFMANAYVFPGGIVDEYDGSKKYESVLENIDTASFAYEGKHIPDVYKVRNRTSLLPEVSFRLSAIRETFEESGILISSLKDPNIDPQSLKMWRKKVFENASEFLDLCRVLKVSPDIENLHEWSCWLTPTDVGSRRFDTMFYICCVDSLPVATVDDSEIAECKWLDPAEALTLHKNREIWLAPPQAYEMTRFLSFKSFDELQHFSVSRARKGVCRWMPVRIAATDGIVSVLPGDELYPEQPDIYGKEKPLETSKSLEELRQCEHMNRFEYQDFFKAKLIVQNVTDPCGHVGARSFDPAAESPVGAKL